MFRDRTDAGAQLADAIAARNLEPTIVLAIPRGGLPLGRAVADRFDAPLDVVVAKKIGAPNNPELALAAVAEDGSVWRNDKLIAQLGVGEDYIESERDRIGDEASQKAKRYREAPLPALSGERVAVVDDGIATGATMRACLARVRAAAPEQLIVGVPVGPRETIEEIEASADAVVCVETPGAFSAVGAYYRNFAQVSDEEAMTYLQ